MLLFSAMSFPYQFINSINPYWETPLSTPFPKGRDHGDHDSRVRVPQEGTRENR